MEGNVAVTSCLITQSREAQLGLGVRGLGGWLGQVYGAEGQISTPHGQFGQGELSGNKFSITLDHFLPCHEVK